jgi:hypothetical protein
MIVGASESYCAIRSVGLVNQSSKQFESITLLKQKTFNHCEDALRFRLVGVDRSVPIFNPMLQSKCRSCLCSFLCFSCVCVCVCVCVFDTTFLTQGQ